MKKSFFAAVLMFTSTATFATNDITVGETSSNQSEFGNEETVEYGMLNSFIEKAAGISTVSATPEYGAKLTDYASVPKIGGYGISKYSWNSDDDKDAKEGFSQRLIRFYVDGTILKDFTYRFQMQFTNASPHMRDYFLEWGKYKEFRIKIGQFKRAFTFENPMNPWDVGTGDFSQLVKKLAGMGDYNGEPASNGGRDQGIQFQGDLFPIGKDRHRLIHYQAMIANGQGINSADANQHKDFIGTIQVQPVKGLFLGVFGWTGNYTINNITVDRKRYAIGAKYTWHDWVLRTEYGHSKGHKISDYRADGSWQGTGEADAFYATVGIPVVSWFNVYLKYDQYRDQATATSRNTIYSVVPTFRLHKNLMLQIQYNYNDNNITNSTYHQVWVETYFRF